MARRIKLAAKTWRALETLSWETDRPLNDLAEEAFADLFKKHRRPRSLREALRALRQSYAAREAGALRRRG